MGRTWEPGQGWQQSRSNTGWQLVLHQGDQSCARPVPVLVGIVKCQGWDLTGGIWDTRNSSDEE